MNMMQNSPLLVAQTSPAKNALNFKQPNEMAEKAEEGKSFKQVLSKQVEQEASKQGGDKATNTKVQKLPKLILLLIAALKRSLLMRKA